MRPSLREAALRIQTVLFADYVSVRVHGRLLSFLFCGASAGD